MLYRQQDWRAARSTIAPLCRTGTALAVEERVRLLLAPMEGLLDDAPAAPKPQDRPADNQPPPPQTVVNQTDMATPVARPVDERFGEIPVAPQPDTLRNQLLDSGTNTQPFDYQDANPSHQPSLSGQTKSADQGYRYVGPSGVDGALPARRYR